MKIIIATGVFPPDIGGPANYVQKLADELLGQNINVEVVAYSENLTGDSDNCFPIRLVSKKQFFLSRYGAFLRQLIKSSDRADAVYAFDLFSCGIPALILKTLKKNIKLAVRLSGDFLWEKAIERGWSGFSLNNYYSQPKNIREKFYIWLTQRILNSADLLIFTTNWQKEIYLKNYKINPDKTEIIANPYPDIDGSFNVESSERKIIFAGRLIILKNIEFLIRVFNEIRKQNHDLKLEIIGEGSQKDNLEKTVERLGLNKAVFFRRGLSHKELIQEVKKSYLVVLPSLSEVSPNLALECIKLKKPILLTKETGFYEQFKDNLIFIDPFNQGDLENKIKELLKPDKYKEYERKISAIDTNYSWPELADSHIKSFKKLL